MMETPIQAQPKKSNTGLIIGIVVVVLLCCCCVVVVVALAMMGPAMSKSFSGINEQLLLTPASGSPLFPNSGTPIVPSDLIPSGGNGDDVQRASAWGYVVVTAALDGCNTSKASDTKIAVTQEADSKGVWKEQWTVVCSDNSKKAYDVTFTPGTGGSTDIKVTSGK